MRQFLFDGQRGHEYSSLCGKIQEVLVQLSLKTLGIYIIKFLGF